jgi:hypothetical protein
MVESVYSRVAASVAIFAVVMFVLAVFVLAV